MLRAIPSMSRDKIICCSACSRSSSGPTADRNHLLHDDAGRNARRAHPHHRRPLRRRCLLRQLLPYGLRIDGRRWPCGHHRRKQEARHDAVPAAGGRVRFASMADADHARQRSDLLGGPALIMTALWRARVIAATAAVALLLPAALFAQDGVDWITKFPRTDVH